MTNLPTEVLANLIASIVGAALAFLGVRAFKLLAFGRPIHRFWGNLISANKLVIAMTSLPTTSKEGNRAVTTVAEATALASLLSMLQREYRGLDIELYPSDRFPSMKLGGSLLLTGGPRNNRITRLLLERFDLPFRIEGGDLIIDVDDGLKLSAIVMEGSVIKDYGLILVMRNPFDEEAYVYLLAGCYAYGVNAAVRALTLPFLRRVSKQIRSEEFMIVVEANVADEYVSVPEILSTYTLTAEDSKDHESTGKKWAISTSMGMAAERKA